MGYLKVNNIKKYYGKGDAIVEAVKGISFNMDIGEFVAVMGESGSGKSTLLTMLGAMNHPTAGEYIVDDIDIYKLENEKQADFRREFLGFVFQSFHLVPYLSVIENVMLPLTMLSLSNKDKQNMARIALGKVGLQEKTKRLPNQLSGGEKERVAIARAIVNNPPIILADEPTGNLDSKTSTEVMQLLIELKKEGSTIIMVTHSQYCAEFAERILQLTDGNLVMDQTVKNVSYV